MLGDTRFDRLLRLEHAHQTLRVFPQSFCRPFYDPKLLLDPPLESEVMRQEIFGPLLPLISYDSIDEALAVVAGLPPALALYWFGPQNARFTRTIERSTSAAVSVNETVIHAGISALPFGGIGASGLGAYHGKAGFDAFTHARPIFRQSRFNLTDLVRPPYGKQADVILKRLLR
jgi:acyl-CoA reductase-like NAD-dependent aldehyde dehydrogenase